MLLPHKVGGPRGLTVPFCLRRGHLGTCSMQGSAGPVSRVAWLQRHPGLGLWESAQVGRASHSRAWLGLSCLPSLPPSSLPFLPPSTDPLCQDAVVLCSALLRGRGDPGGSSLLRRAAAAQGKGSRGEGEEQLWWAFPPAWPSPASLPASDPSLGSWPCHRLSVMPPDLVRSHSLVCPSGALAQVSSLVRGHVAGTLDQGLHPQVWCSLFPSSPFIISGIVFQYRGLSPSLL